MRSPGYYWLNRASSDAKAPSDIGLMVHVDERGWIYLCQPDRLVSEEQLNSLGLNIGLPMLSDGGCWTGAEQLYEDATWKWGISDQLEIPIEECSELITAIQHFKRDRVDHHKVLEEAVDVINSVGQLLFILALTCHIRFESFVALTMMKLRRERERTRRKIEGLE